MHDYPNTTPERPLESTTTHTRRHTRHTAAHTSCANERQAPQTKGCSLGIDSNTARCRTSSTPSPACHRAAGGSQAAICERWRVVKKGSRGSGERCITHRKCSREPLLSADQLRVARLSQPEQNDTHGSRASRQLRAICSTGRARAPTISRRACRVPFTCRVAPAKPRPGVVARRYGVAPSRIQRGKAATRLSLARVSTLWGSAFGLPN